MAVRRRLCALGVCFVVVFSAAAAAAADQSGEVAPSNESMAEVVSSAQSAAKMPGLRTAYSDTYRMSNGRRETNIYPEPVNYRDQQSGWQPIGTNLDWDGSGFANNENLFAVHLPTSLGAGAEEVSVGTHLV
jgi:hypothetical protein